MNGRTALLVGATGLVGGQLLPLLLAEPRYHRVRVLARRPSPLSDEKLEWHQVDLDREEAWRPLVAADEVFCCLGTTIEQAGSQEEFRRIDAGLPLALAAAARAAGATRLVVVSAVGASPRSSVFYCRVKGELEDGLRALGFPSLVLLRPSLLLGARREPRRGERVGAAVMRALRFLLVGRLRRYRPVDAAAVARAMLHAAASPPPGVTVLEGEALLRRGRAPE